MKLIDGEKLHDTLCKHYEKGGEHREAYLDCALITKLQESIEAITVEYLLNQIQMHSDATYDFKIVMSNIIEEWLAKQ